MKLLLAPNHRYSGLWVNGSSRNKSGHFFSKAALQEPSRAHSSCDFLSSGRGGAWCLRPLPQLQCPAVHLTSPVLQELGRCPSTVTARGGRRWAWGLPEDRGAFGCVPCPAEPKSWLETVFSATWEKQGQCSFYIRISICFSWEGLSLVWNCDLCKIVLICWSVYFLWWTVYSIAHSKNWF